MSSTTPRYFLTLHAILGALSVSAISASDGPETQAEKALLSDPRAECTPYGYPPVTNALNGFPTVWAPASLVTGDTEAHAQWITIRPNVPDIAPKGTLTGNASGLHYPASDPDCWWTYGKCTTPKAPGLLPDIAVMPEPETLGYGFDDGPNCSHNTFYSYLSSQNQKATMFYVGSNVMNWPLQAQRAVTDGHEICAHSWSHHYMTSFKSEDAFAEIYYTIKLVTGVTPTCWRPPFGDTDDRIRAIASGMGLRTIIWNYDSEDWQFGDTPGFTAEDVGKNYRRIIDDADNGYFANAGAMILAHELNNFTMQEAMKYYPLLKKAFKHILPVGVGLNITNPYLEKGYTQLSFEQYVADTTMVHGSKTNAVASASASSVASSTRLTQAKATETNFDENAPSQSSGTSPARKFRGGNLGALTSLVGALTIVIW